MILELFLAELRRSLIQSTRYSAEIIGGLMVTTIIFYGLFLSTRYVTGGSFQFGDRFDSIIIGYVLWTLMIFIQGSISGNLQEEARTGTLEQIFLSPYGASQVFLSRAIASLFINLTLNISILLVIMALTGSSLSFPLILLLPLITVLLGAYGLSFIMGSLALMLKQVQQALGIFQFGLLFLFTAPIESWTGGLQILGYCMPMAPGAGLLRDVMARGEGLDGRRTAIALLNGILYFTLGMLLFRWSERETKRRGKLGGY